MSDLDDTAGRLVAAAEALFVVGGEEATSLRAVTRAARSNAAAVHYHFGGRDELLRAVLARYLEPLAARRLAALDEVRAASPGPGPVEAVLEALVRPDLELLAELRPERVRVAHLLGRATALPGSAVAELVARQRDALVAQALPLLADRLPAVPAAELGLRLRLVLATVAHLFVTAPGPTEPGPLGSDDVTEQVQRLVAFAGGGLAAYATMKVGKKRKKRG